MHQFIVRDKKAGVTALYYSYYWPYPEIVSLIQERSVHKFEHWNSNTSGRWIVSHSQALFFFSLLTPSPSPPRAHLDLTWTWIEDHQKVMSFCLVADWVTCTHACTHAHTLTHTKKKGSLAMRLASYDHAVATCTITIIRVRHCMAIQAKSVL